MHVVFDILSTVAVAMPVSADNRPINFLEFLPVDSRSLSALSSVFPHFNLPLFPLCKSPIDPPFSNLQTIFATIFYCGGFDT